MDFSLHFGCGLFVHNKTEENPFMLFQGVPTNSELWENWRSEFMSLNGTASFDFNSGSIIGSDNYLLSKISKLDF